MGMYRLLFALYTTMLADELRKCCGFRDKRIFLSDREVSVKKEDTSC